MVVDTSVIFAIVLDEPEARAFVARVMASPRPMVSAASVVELAAVGTRRFAGTLDARIDHAMTNLGLTIVGVTPSQGVAAAEAYRRFGIGTEHPAKLNFGDCFSYALAKETGEPLLFKGDDFTHTDVIRAI